MPPLPWLDVPGLLNARDVSALQGAEGLRPGVLLRSACPNEVTREGVDVLTRRLGVARVVDLRSTRERALAPDGLLAHADAVEHLHHSLTAEELDLREGLPWEFQTPLSREARRTGAGYIRFLRDRPDSVLGALRAIAKSPGATLVHCSAGKDRTGVIVALALSVLGIPMPAILADFTASNTCLDALLAQQRRTGYGHLYKDRPPESYRVHPEAMEGLLAYLADDFGGVRGWLGSVGWTTNDQDRLNARLRFTQEGGD